MNRDRRTRDHKVRRQRALERKRAAEQAAVDAERHAADVKAAWRRFLAIRGVIRLGETDG